MDKEQRRAAKGATAAYTSRLAEGDDQAEQTASARRFSAKGLAAQRRRLGLSAEDCARLLGVFSVSIYKCEAGTTQPRASFMPAIVQLRTLGNEGRKGQARSSTGREHVSQTPRQRLTCAVAVATSLAGTMLFEVTPAQVPEVALAAAAKG